MPHLLVGPLADSPMQICFWFPSKGSWILFSLSIIFGWVEIISFKYSSVKILAESTILSFFLNNGYCIIFFMPAYLEIK